VSKLWRYDWCKNICWYVVVGSNTGDCATRWWDYIGWADEYFRCTVLKFRSACSTGLPQSQQGSSSYIPAWKFVLLLLKQQPRHWSQMVPKKTLAFCSCSLSCIWNLNELVCSKMEKVGSKSNETLQVQKVAVVATWRCDRIIMVLRNLLWPELKPHDNFVLPNLVNIYCNTFFKKRGVLLWRGVTIWMNLLEFVKVLFPKSVTIM